MSTESKHIYSKLNTKYNSEDDIHALPLQIQAYEEQTIIVKLLQYHVIGLHATIHTEIHTSSLREHISIQ